MSTPPDPVTPRPFRLLGEEQIANLTPRQKMLYYALAVAELNRRAEAAKAFFDDEEYPPERWSDPQLKSQLHRP